MRRILVPLNDLSIFRYRGSRWIWKKRKRKGKLVFKYYATKYYGSEFKLLLAHDHLFLLAMRYTTSVTSYRRGCDLRVPWFTLITGPATSQSKYCLPLFLLLLSLRTIGQPTRESFRHPLFEPTSILVDWFYSGIKLIFPEIASPR